MMFGMHFYPLKTLRFSRWFFGLALGVFLLSFAATPAQAADATLECREDHHCMLMQDKYCGVVKAVPVKTMRKWRRDNLKQAAEKAQAGEICPPVLPSKLQIENYFPLCIAGICRAGMIPGRQ